MISLSGAALLLSAAGTMAVPSHHQARNHHEIAQRAEFGKRFYADRVTWYPTNTGPDACTGKNHQDSDNIVALAIGAFGNGKAWCGKQIKITSSSGKTAIGVIQDACATCSGDEIDLTKGLFQKFATLDQGVFTGTWTLVDGSDDDGDDGDDKPKTTKKTTTSTTKTTAKATPTTTRKVEQPTTTDKPDPTPTTTSTKKEEATPAKDTATTTKKADLAAPTPDNSDDDDDEDDDGDCEEYEDDDEETTTHVAAPTHTTHTTHDTPKASPTPKETPAKASPPPKASPPKVDTPPKVNTPPVKVDTTPSSVPAPPAVSSPIPPPAALVPTNPIPTDTTPTDAAGAAGADPSPTQDASNISGSISSDGSNGALSLSQNKVLSTILAIALIAIQAL